MKFSLGDVKPFIQSSWKQFKKSWNKPKRIKRFLGWSGSHLSKLRAPRYRDFNPALKFKQARSFRRQRLEKRSISGLKSVPQIFAEAVAMLRGNKWLFFKATLIHGLVYFFLVRAPESISVGDLSELIDSAKGEQSLPRRTYDLTITVLGLKADSIQQPLQAIIVWIVTSLSYIWLMREIINRKANGNKKPILAREGYYRGQTGFASVGMILLTMVAELIPFALGFWIYSTADTNVIFTNTFEQSLFIGLWVMLGFISLYGLLRSAIALYFATIPDVFPIEAQQMASSVIRYRRLAVGAKMIWLLVIALLLVGMVVVATIAFAPQYAFIAVDAVMVLFVPIHHLMFYRLYLDLVQDHSLDEA